jgi:DNA polymerase-4
MSSPARILLADADQFFVAVARLVDPEGAGKAPLLIVGGVPGSRGVVCSASYETRKFGVRSAMPISRALRLCPDAMCVGVPRGACSEKSREIRTVLERFTPVVRGASVDEWYLDLGGTEALYHHEPLETTARRIRDAVTAQTGLSVSLGGGTNRLIAKLAVEFAKPKPGSAGTGVYVVAPGDEARFMADQVALADIPGIGPKFQRELAARDLVRVADILPHDLPTLTRWFGERTANWLWQRARGMGDASVTPRKAQKQVSREDTFSHDITADAEIERELLRLAAKVAADLRSDGLVGRTVTVKLKYADFTIRTASRTLPEPIEADRPVADVATALLASMRRRRGGPVRLVGVGLSGLLDAGDRQLSIFDSASENAARLPNGQPPVETEKDRTVSHALDAVRDRFGPQAIRRGAANRRAE